MKSADQISALEDWLLSDPLKENESVVMLGNEMVEAGYAAAKESSTIPPTMRLFSPTVRMLCPLEKEGYLTTARTLIKQLQDGCFKIEAYGKASRYVTMGLVKPGHAAVYPNVGLGWSAEALAEILATVAHMCCLISVPRFVEQAPMPRQICRRIDRKAGSNASARVSIISWNLTKPRLKEGETLGKGRHMPLHYTRGHWRQCAEHLDRAQLHDDGSHRMWIEGFWSGHPAYGTVRSIYAPKI